jgi:3-oxoacyl-[acyl-carrier protein] reductase
MYAATKGALEAFSRNVAREWGVKGIRSNCVAPGFMETEMSRSLTATQRERIYKRTSMKIATDPSSVAETVRFLISDESSSITGQVILVDSGTI